MNKLFKNCVLLVLLSLFVFSFSLPARSGEYIEHAITPENAKIGFNLDSTLHLVHGKAKEFKGVLRIPRSMNPGELYTELTVQVKEMDTDNEKRDNKMHNYCFEMEKFPGLRFKSTQFKDFPSSPQPGVPFEFTLVGDLTIRDVTLEVVIPVKAETKDGQTHFSGRAPLNYIKDFKIKDPSVFIFRVAKEVEVFFELDIPSL